RGMGAGRGGGVGEEGAASGEGADQRNRAHPASFGAHIEGEPARQRSLAGKKFGGVGSGNIDPAAGSDTLGAAQEGQFGADAPTGNGAVAHLQSKFRFSKAQRGMHVAGG